MRGSIVDIQSATVNNRRGKKNIDTTAAKYNGLPYWAAINTISIKAENPFGYAKSMVV